MSKHFLTQELTSSQILFKYHRGFQMTSRKFHKLFKEVPRTSEKELTQFHMDLAASIQVIT